MGQKVVLITGGSRGIGAACARKLAALGADIAVVYAGNAEKRLWRPRSGDWPFRPTWPTRSRYKIWLTMC